MHEDPVDSSSVHTPPHDIANGGDIIESESMRTASKLTADVPSDDTNTGIGRVGIEMLARGLGS